MASSLTIRRAGTPVVPLVDRVPPQAYFVTSALFHYLGPAFAVILFAQVDVVGVAWLRIAAAAAVYAIWLRPWRAFAAATWETRRLLIAMGLVLAAMNTVFYLAISRLPLGTVGAIEFVGPILLAAIGIRSLRNGLAFALAIGGVAFLADVRLAGEPLGFAFAFANLALFLLYVVIGHRLAADGGSAGIDRIGAAMLIALIAVTPIGLWGALPTLGSPLLLAAGIGVGITSSVIPYVCDQLAMARLPRATFALMLALLPATAVVVGVVVLGQIPSLPELAGVGLVIAGVAVHRSG